MACSTSFADATTSGISPVTRYWCSIARIGVALERVVQCADEVARVHKREGRRGLVGRDEVHAEAEVAGGRAGKVEEVHPLRRTGKVDSPGDVDAARLAGRFLDLTIELDRVFLQLGDVGVAVQRVHAAGGVPRRAGGQLVALDQHDVGPAGPREVV